MVRVTHQGKNSRARREPKARIRFTSSDAAVCALLVLTVIGAAVQAGALLGSAKPLLLAVTALCLLIGFWRPRLWAAAIGIIIVAGGATALVLTIFPDDATFFAAIVSGAVAAGLGFVAIWVSTHLRRVHRRLNESRRIIDSLTQIDPTTGTFKPSAGRDRLRTEIARSVRYQRPFSLLVGRPCNLA